MGRFGQGFKDIVALVTGGASGIGEATAKRLAEEGAQVIVTDLNVEGGQAVATSIGGEFQKLDVGDPQAWKELVEDILKTHGALHLVHLNAGVTTSSGEAGDLSEEFDIATMPLENYRRVMSANVDGVILGARACVPAMKASGGGCFVATASAAGVIAFPPDPVYTATKHAVVGFVRALAPLLEPHEIMFHAVLPGVVNTNILASEFATEARAIGIKVMEPEEIADGVIHAARSTTSGGLWLCLPEQAPYRYEFAPVKNLGMPEPE